MTQLAEVVVTDDQAKLIAAAADVALRSHADEEHGLITLDEDELTNMQRLAMFFGVVAEQPHRFPVTGRMAIPLKKAKREAREAAKEVHGTNRSVRNKRKARQESRMGAAKRRRRERREFVENFNRAREITEREVAEMQELQEQRQREIENEPKFNVTDIMGNVLLEGVPQSMIVAADLGADTEDVLSDVSESATLADASAPKIIMPGSAEALGIE